MTFDEIQKTALTSIRRKTKTVTKSGWLSRQRVYDARVQSDKGHPLSEIFDQGYLNPCGGHRTGLGETIEPRETMGCD